MISDQTKQKMAHVKALKDKGMDAAHNLLFLCSNCHAALDMAKHTRTEWDDDILTINLPNQAPAVFKTVEGKLLRRISSTK